MNTHTFPLSTKQAPTRTDIDNYIAQAHQMRADQIAKSLKSGWATLRGFVLHKPVFAQAAAKLSPAHS